MHARLTVDADALQQTLRRLAKMAGRVCGAGLWALDDGVLTVEWSGGADELQGKGAGRARVRVGGEHMRGLGKLGLGGGSVDLSVRDGRLFVGTLSVPCAPVTEAVSPVLPAVASQRDLLLAARRHARTDLDAAGHAAELARAEERLAGSIDRAAHALSWLGVSAADLDLWIEAHLESLAKGGAGLVPSLEPAPTPRIVVVDGSGPGEPPPRR